MPRNSSSYWITGWGAFAMPEAFRQARIYMMSIYQHVSPSTGGPTPREIQLIRPKHSIYSYIWTVTFVQTNHSFCLRNLLPKCASTPIRRSWIENVWREVASQILLRVSSIAGDVEVWGGMRILVWNAILDRRNSYFEGYWKVGC